MKIALVADGPLDAVATLARYHLWGEDPVNRLDGDVFRRILRLDGRLLAYEVRWSGGVDDTRLSVTVHPAAEVTAWTSGSNVQPENSATRAPPAALRESRRRTDPIRATSSRGSNGLTM